MQPNKKTPKFNNNHYALSQKCVIKPKIAQSITTRTRLAIPQLHKSLWIKQLLRHWENARKKQWKREKREKRYRKPSQRSLEADPAASDKRTVWTAPSDGAVSPPIGSKPIIRISRSIIRILNRTFQISEFPNSTEIYQIHLPQFQSRQNSRNPDTLILQQKYVEITKKGSKVGIGFLEKNENTKEWKVTDSNVGRILGMRRMKREM